MLRQDGGDRDQYLVRGQAARRHLAWTPHPGGTRHRLGEVFAVGVFRDEQSARNWAAGMDARCAEDRDDEILDDDQDLLQ